VLGKDVLPAIGNIPAKAVTRDDVIRVLDVISARGSNRRADTARAVISSIFGYASTVGLCPTILPLAFATGTTISRAT